MKIWFALLALVPSLSFAADMLTESAPDCICENGTKIPFEEPIKYGFGPYKGQCVDSCRFRPLHVLSEKNGTIEIANIIHKGVFWKAEIVARDVEHVDMGLEDFMRGISHVILRFRFKDPQAVKLTPLVGNGKAEYIQDIVVSAEGVPPKGLSYNLSDGAFGNYLIVYRVLSLNDTIAWMVVDKQHRVSQRRLSLQPDQGAKLLRLALQRSADIGFTQKYDLFTNNCATSAIGLVEETLGRPTRASGVFAGLDRLERAIPYQGFWGSLTFMDREGLLLAFNEKSGPLDNLEIEALKSVYSVSQPTTRPPSK